MYKNQEKMEWEQIFEGRLTHSDWTAGSVRGIIYSFIDLVTIF